MCNAYGHPQPCGCGFGPLHGNPGDPIPRVPQGGKFQGRVHRGPRKSFGEQAIASIGELRRGLREVGADRRAINKVIEAYRKEGFPKNRKHIERLSDKKRFDLANIVKQIIGVRKYKIEKKKTTTIRVPLFTFGAPSIKNSKVTYQETTDFSHEIGWVVSLVIPGVGMGASQEFDTQFSCKFTCVPGEFKTIFVPIRIRVNKLGIYEHGIRIKDGGLRITAEAGKLERNYRRGIESCRKKDCLPFSEPEIEEFLLSRNKKGDISTYVDELSMKKPFDIGIGLDILGVKTALKAKVSLIKKLKLEYDLPGGHNYRLYLLKERMGIGWKVSRPRTKKRKTHYMSYRGKQHGHPNHRNRKARGGQLHPRAVTLH
jgi:hypothetical protein